MNISKLKLYNCFNILDKKFFNDFSSNINKRIIFQKYGLFFAKIFDLQFGRYSLYLHGPYNSTLADIGYEIDRLSDTERLQINEELKNIKFNKIAEDIITLLKTKLTLDNVNFLEVFSTYFYLINYRNLSRGEAEKQTSLLKKDLINDVDNSVEKTVLVYNAIKEQINNITNKTILV